MNFYRTLFAAIAAIGIASPVFADDTAMQAAPVATTETTSMQPSASTEQSTPAAEVKVNVNKASAKDLLKVKGINASKARAIVSYRKKHGEFKAMDDLAKVKSLGKLKAPELKAIRDQLSLS